MERTICLIILILNLLPDIQANTLGPSSTGQYTTPGGSYRFKCTVGSPSVIDFYRSDEPSPVCSILFNGVSCTGYPSSSKYKCGCTRSNMAKNSLTIYDVNRNDTDNVKWNCGNPFAASNINLLYPSKDEACSIYSKTEGKNKFHIEEKENKCLNR